MGSASEKKPKVRTVYSVMLTITVFELFIIWSVMVLHYPGQFADLCVGFVR